ncbi:hypothetical protein JCM11251_001653 [Rhodosporidiobolus azoricus]
MSDSTTATVHIYQPPGAAPLRDEDVNQRRSAAWRLVEACAEPARTSRGGGFVQLQRPLQACASSKPYEARPPEFLSPRRIRQSRLPHSVDTGQDDSPAAADVPPFIHWRTSSASASALAPTSSLAAPQQQQTQSILRKRSAEGSAPVITAGAWAPAETRRERKKVRVESPRTTTTNTRAGGADSATIRKGKAKELVPATPEEEPRAVDCGDEEVSDLGEGAVQRCIPYPYCHTDTIPSSDPNPARQHPARILHSFADPSFTADAPFETGPTSLSAAPRSHSLVRVNSGTSQLPQLAATSPKTPAFLQVGRRGSWLVPISRNLPIPHTSSPRWLPSYPIGRSAFASPSSSSLPHIDWTDGRLRSLWSFLDSLHKSGGLGSLRVHCHIPSPSASLPSYLKITTDAHLALPLRGVLNQLNVKAMLLSSTGSSNSGGRKTRRKGEAGQEGDAGPARGGEVDVEKFLKGRVLVWVDEMGRAVFTA